MFFFLFSKFFDFSCSTDPTVIHLSSEMNSYSNFHYSFYLHNILKEAIPFEIQCKILTIEQNSNPINCSSLTFIDNEQLLIPKNEKKDSSTYVLFRSFPIEVIKQLPKNLIEQDKSKFPSNSF